MHGFKSFASKEVMKLGQGITTVVGPNGCGKTNIVDAIRWVLGEQKYSVLRSGKMEDVIFNGADGIKPLSVCEVAMTVHNSSGKLPIEYNDIEIARRIYRNGESEYYLNKTQCRLKDISDLFIDTGMGADAYSVIELKMIEQILSDTADDRRKMFEEAAGIHKYRSQRKATIKRFETTHMDLERIQDIISEVEQKVRNLELQLKRYKRHATLSETIQNKDQELAFLQVHRFNSQIKPLKNRIEEYRHLRENKTSESSVLDNELIQLQDTYKSQESELNHFQEAMAELNQSRESLRNGILVSTEKRRGALITIERLEREKNSNFTKIENLKQLKLDFDKEITELEPTIEGQLREYKSEREKFNIIENKYQKAVQTLDNTQNERWELQRKIADDVSLYDRTKALIDDKSIDLNNFKKLIQIQKECEKSDLISQKNLEKDKLRIQKSILKSEKELCRLEKEFENFINEKNSISEQQHKSSAMIKSLKGQQKFYSELVESRDGFPEGTRYVLENPNLFPGILGTVADVFQTEISYRDALESALGDLSHCLIAKDRSHALDTLEKVSQENLGALTIIPLKEASYISTELKELPSSNLIISRASNLVETSKELRPLANYLLGNVLVVDDFSSAINSEELTGWNLVDKAGGYFGEDYVLKNRQFSDYGHMIGRKEKLDGISIELDKLIKKENKIKKLLESITKTISSQKDKIDSQLIDNERLRKNLSEIDISVARVQMKIEQNFEKLNALIQNKEDLRKEMADSKKSLIALEPLVHKAKNKLKDHQSKVERENDLMLIIRKERDDFQNTLQEIRIKLIELEARRDQLKFKKKSGEETSSELKIRQDKIRIEINELRKMNDNLQSDSKNSEKELESINAAIQKQRSIIDLKQAVYRETYQNIEELQARISTEQRDREQLLEELKNSELEAKETEQKIQLVIERISDRYNKKLPEKLIVNQTEEQLEIEIEKIQRSIDNIGPVNMAVQDEYNEEVSRLEVLLTQRDDLVDAEENLRETIRKIDKIARKRFQETFDLIKINFEKLFKMFFEGGNATLKLIGDPDPLEADISIEAQPPGKRNTSLRLLSSGEKALTAISLLFSIYQVKPSPYCILDEVDAPLDDVNIHKFTRVLGKFSDETQFIIVTHNKLTMEIADYMYGVTQEKKGISKLVSVKFD